MKKILLLLSVILLQSTVSIVDAAKPTPRQKLIQRLAKIQKKGYMYAHQDDTFYGITWDWDQNRSDTRELVGDYPAVCGYDLGGLEVGDAKDLDSVPFSRIREDAIRQYEAGGIITFSWHPRNPLLGTTAWIQNDTTAYNQAVEALCKMRQCNVAKQVIDPKTTVKSVLPGGSQNAKYMQWLKRLADFMLTLKDKKGNQIPFIFRPFHENNGSWFWWGQKLCSDAEYHALWNMTQDYINSVVCSTDGSKLADYLMWSYSPNLQGNWTEEEWLKRYPEIREFGKNIDVNIIRNNLLVDCDSLYFHATTPQIESGNHMVSSFGRSVEELCSGAILHPLGIRTIPISEMGIRRNRYLLEQ